MSIHTLKCATAAAALMLATGAAQAGAGSPTIAVQQATADFAAKPATEKRYCVRTTITGSRMEQKVCRTRKAWLAEGFDPTAPNN